MCVFESTARSYLLTSTKPTAQHYVLYSIASLPSDGDNTVFMLDIKSLGQQSTIFPDLAKKN